MYIHIYVYIFSVENLESRKTFFTLEVKKNKMPSRAAWPGWMVPLWKVLAKAFPEWLTSQDQGHSGSSWCPDIKRWSQNMAGSRWCHISWVSPSRWVQRLPSTKWNVSPFTEHRAHGRLRRCQLWPRPVQEKAEDSQAQVLSHWRPGGHRAELAAGGHSLFSSI